MEKGNLNKKASFAPNPEVQQQTVVNLSDESDVFSFSRHFHDVLNTSKNTGIND